MNDPKAHVAVLVDFDSLARCVSPAGEPWDAGELAAAVLRYAAGVGRITLARGYADWSRRSEDAKAIHAARVVPVLCPTGPEGEDRAPFRLAVDALEQRYAGGEPDAVVLVTADGRLLPLVHALRADGAEVILVAPSAASVDALRAEVDAHATLGDALAGVVGAACTPRPAVDDDEADDADDASDASGAELEAAAPSRPSGGGHDDGAPRGFERGRRPGDDASSRPRAASDAPRRGFERGPRRASDGPPSFERARRGGDGGGSFDRSHGDRGPRGSSSAPSTFEGYDWSGFIRLIDELEHRLPFVGVRYLVNKVIGPRNCGIDDPRLKRDLINRAVDEGHIEMFDVPNVEGRGDPVTACRLVRGAPAVAGVLGGATVTPRVAEAQDRFEAIGGGGGRDDDGGGTPDAAPSSDA